MVFIIDTTQVNGDMDRGMGGENKFEMMAQFMKDIGKIIQQMKEED